MIFGNGCSKILGNDETDESPGSQDEQNAPDSKPDE
jgi:hypothetical protein